MHPAIPVREGLVEAIGNTPLIRLKGPSEATGCEILGKAEFMNPGQSVKDRAALWIIRDAEARGALRPGGTIVEGTAGNTGIGLALVGAARGYRTVIVIPETQSQEKKDTIRLAGATLVQVPAAPYRNPDNYVRYSGRLAECLAETEPNGAIWANQFDNTANRQAHVEGTAPEILRDCPQVDGFICAVGTGGTLAGVARGLRAAKPDVRIGLADPDGAALFDYYAHGELRSEGSSITEGIGQGRITANLEGLEVDLPYRIPRRRGAAGGVRPAAGRGADPGRFLRDQRRRRDADGAGHGPGAHDRHDPVRLRHPLRVEALQRRVPAIEGPAGPGLARRAARGDAVRLRRWLNASPSCAPRSAD